MELTQLISFYHVARLQSVSKASEIVCRSQPAVSQQLKTLEEEIGCSLFDRIGKRKLVMTPEGKRLQRFAKEFIHGMDTALDDIQTLCGGSRGTVSISAPFTTCYQLLPEVLQKFADHFPKVMVTLFDLPQGKAVARVRDGESDLVIALESAVPRGLYSIFWKRVEPVLMAPVGHPLAGCNTVSIQDIAQLKLIAPPGRRRHPGRLLLEKAARKAGLSLNVVLEVSNVEISSKLVEQGLGVSFATIVEKTPLLKGRNLAFIPLKHLLPGGKLVIAMTSKESCRGVRARFIEMLLST